MTTSLRVEPLGARIPRVCSCPSAATFAAGREAIELAESAGLYLDGWQQDVLTASLGETAAGNWAAFEVGVIVPRQNGKGAILEARELAGLFLFGEKMIVHTSHEFKTSLEAYRRLRALIESTPDLDRKVKQYWQTTGYEGIELTNGARLRFLARSKGSGRGFSGDLVILDEAFALTDDQVEALLPTLSARPNPQVWYTSSPPLDGITGAPLYSLRARGEAAGNGLAWFDWGAEPGANVDDPAVWAQANPALGIRISEEFVARERQAMSPEGFGRERLGIWPKTAADQWRVITEAQWLAAEDPHSAPLDPLVFAISMDYDRKHACIALAGARADGDLHVEVPPLDHRSGTGWVVARAVELNERWKPARWVVAGPAASLIPDLEAAGLEVTKVTPAEAAAGFGMLYDGLTRKPGELAADQVEGEEPRPVRRVWHRPSPALAVALAGAKDRPAGDAGRTWESRDTDVDMSPVRAITDALWGFLTRPVEQPTEAWVMYG